MNSTDSFKILIVDDSRLMRQIIKDIISPDPRFTICGTAGDGFEALEKIRELKPDAITLDIEMPRMTGLEFLEKAAEQGLHTPVLVFSVLTQKGARTTFQALEKGAVDFVPKPGPGSGFAMGEIAQMLRGRLEGLYDRRETDRARQAKTSGESPGGKAATVAVRRKRPRLVVMGCSTGGPKALSQVLPGLDPALSVPVVIVQHMPEGFTRMFAERMDHLTSMAVREAADGMALEPGTITIARGNHHLLLEKKDGNFICRLDSEKPAVNGHRPSIDVCMNSANELTDGKVLGVILTGMGKDGARGMLAIHDAGGVTLGQDESSSVVYGMNRQARELGAVGRELPAQEISGEINRIILENH